MHKRINIGKRVAIGEAGGEGGSQGGKVGARWCAVVDPLQPSPFEQVQPLSS